MKQQLAATIAFAMLALAGCTKESSTTAQSPEQGLQHQDPPNDASGDHPESDPGAPKADVDNNSPATNPGLGAEPAPPAP